MPNAKSDGKKQSFDILRAEILGAPLGYFDDFLEFSEEGETEDVDLGIEDEDNFDINIDDADIGELDIETGELGNDPNEELFDYAERAVPKQADIEFFINEDRSIGNRIYLGNLSFDEEVVNQRLYALRSMAEFLVKYQPRFLLSPDIKTAYENLRSFGQKDFLKFHNEKYPDNKKKYDWTSRTIMNKNVQAPFSRMLIPVSNFFDDLWEKVIILKTAIDYHLESRNKSVPLGASEQSNILYFVTGKTYSKGDISRTIWDKLKFFYEKEDHLKIRLDGGQGSKSRHNEDYLREIAQYVRQKRESELDAYEPE
jgi:hypothetical protein